MILDDIAAAARKRVEKEKNVLSLSDIKKMALELPTGDFKFEKALQKADIAFICEVKKASPSKGIIAEEFDYMNIAREYEAAGAEAISVLTEPDFFCGSDNYLTEIKQVVDIPLLRKDFIIDEYQLYQAKVIGADAVLLISALLDTETIRYFLDICGNLGLSALVEAHTEDEVKSAIAAGAKIIGVNNRNLKTFEVDFNICTSLRAIVPKEILFIAESGIKKSEDIKILRDANVDAILIGETLMRASDKKAALKNLKGDKT